MFKCIDLDVILLKRQKMQ